ncbi:Na+/H+ antiporter NhaA [Shinella sp.]|uniref:Na+/H+ antiporter NhaA n=1 Tax=Shinella sp. TaxID=1870904 RepID=UPI002585B9BC|nr:Na+/H+ antiporter NhaA [Shinella sp.]MCW5712702.1 Na+/H+ antiporter NhaA [Shinella sp.]
MKRTTPAQKRPRAQILTERALASLERFLHIEAVSGAVLLVAAAVALIWANSPLSESYHHLWHMSLSVGVSELVFDRPLHFWINDALMTVFFLVVGMEIRREIHEGALSDLRQASLPIAAAIGGVVVPALVYLALNGSGPQAQGWAIPTATDIAFAVGVLALLGKSIPGNVRVFLLTLAIIDDVIAVLIIAFFYSGGLEYGGFAVAALGIVMVFALQGMGVGSAYVYVLPGAIIWSGLLMTGAHPTLAGVVLGLMTPVTSVRLRENPLDALSRIATELLGLEQNGKTDHMSGPLKELRRAQRELLPPVVRVQAALHPWVAYGVMPLFALANAGVSFAGVNLSGGAPLWVMIGVGIALIAGKPLGVASVSWLLVRLGLCRLPPGMGWGSVWLIGLLAGIGFTMSIFVSMLAFTDEDMLAAAKLGVLAGSFVSALLGLGWGVLYARGISQKDVAGRGNLAGYP